MIIVVKLHENSLWLKHKKKKIIKFISGASLNPAPDNTRLSSSNNPSQNNPQQPQVDPNYIFGRPNQNPNPINPNYKGFPQYPPPQPPQQKGSGNYPNFPIFGNPNPYQPTNPYIFGHPPAGSSNFPGQIPGQYPPYNNNNFGRTTKKPSLWDEFLYNKQPHKRNTSATLNVGITSILLCLHGHLIYRWLMS